MPGEPLFSPHPNPLAVSSLRSLNSLQAGRGSRSMLKRLLRLAVEISRTIKGGTGRALCIQACRWLFWMASVRGENEIYTSRLVK